MIMEKDSHFLTQFDSMGSVSMHYRCVQYLEAIIWLDDYAHKG